MGDDAAAGTSAAHPWRTTARLNAAVLRPGDVVHLAGGQVFTGGIWIRGRSQGTPSQPIVFRSYGVGRATVASGDDYGFYAHNTAGIEVRSINFIGSGRISNRNSGVIFYLDSANVRLNYLRLDSLNVSGYQNSGASLGSWNGESGYADVRITNCRFFANGEAGLSSYAFYPSAGLAHSNWYVGNCVAYDNAGRADVGNTHTGNGIVLSGIDGARIERCEAYNNGWLNANPSGGPVGIWGWCCNNLVIQHCESHHNRSGTTKDGGGFDLDGGCTNSVLQYNYSHDNQGPGFLLAQFPGAPPMHDLTVRYNVSENDARGYDQGALHVWSSGANGGIVRADFYNNTVLLTPPADGSQPKAVFINSGGITGISFRNNVLQTSGGLPLLSTYTTAGLRLEGNCYWSGTAPLLLNWNGTTYNNLADWQRGTSQEQLANGRLTGLHEAPQLGSSPNFVPAPESPLRGAGLSLKTEFNINPGPYDFRNNPTPQAPARGNIGALETLSSVTASAPLPVVLISFTVQQQNASALLNWRTASEKNNAYFLIERSFDGQTFVGVQQVPGFGNSTQPRGYRFTDDNVGRYGVHTIYYRLRQVDADGLATYSPVCALSGIKQGVDNLNELQAWPNPATPLSETISVMGAPGTQVQLLNVTGQLLRSARVQADGNASMPVVGLAAAVYVLRCGGLTSRLVLTN